MNTDKPLIATVETPEARGSAEQSQGGLIRSITFQAAWDKRDPDPKKNYGVSGVDIVFVLRGPEGAVRFRVLTGWMLPEVTEWHRTLTTGMIKTRQDYAGLPAPFQIHSVTPKEDWEYGENCELTGGPCWATNSGYLETDAVWEKMLREGSEGFWKTLEEIYRKNLVGEGGGEYIEV